METKRKPPNPNGNPNFRGRWDNLGETATIRLPQSLHEPFKRLASDINDGRIKLSDLPSESTIESLKFERRSKNMGLAVEIAKERITELEANVAAVTEERNIALNDLKKLYRDYDALDDRCSGLKKLNLLAKVEDFEQLQNQSWGKAPNQRGEFTTASPRWEKFKAFKSWLANQ